MKTTQIMGKTIFIFLLLFATIFISCSDNDDNLGLEDLRCTVEIINDDNEGTVSGAGLFKKGDDVTLTVTPNEYRKFSGWFINNELVATETNYSFTIEKNVTIVTKYNQEDCTISLKNTDGGEITGGGTFPSGTSVTLKATPKEFYKFLGWYEGENLLSTLDTYTFNVKTSMVIEGRFTHNEGVLNVIMSGEQVSTFYKRPNTIMCFLQSNDYTEYMVKIVPENRDVADFMINNTDANNETEVLVRDGNVEISVNPKVKVGDTNFKVVVYSDPKIVKESKSVKLKNNGVYFEAHSTSGIRLINTTSKNLGYFTFEDSRAIDGGVYIFTNNIIAQTYEYGDLLISADPLNGMPDYYIFDMIAGSYQKITQQPEPCVNYGLFITERGAPVTSFEFNRSMGTNVAKNSKRPSLGWQEEHLEYFIIENKAGYSVRVPVKIQFKK